MATLPKRAASRRPVARAHARPVHLTPGLITVANLDFWVVVATTVPVLALALVVQARDGVRRVRGARAILARILAFNYGVALISSAALMTTAMVILTGVVSADERDRFNAMGGVAYLIAMTIVEPAIKMFLVAFSGAMVFARGELALIRMRRTDYRNRARIRLIRRKIWRNARLLSRAVDDLYPKLLSALDLGSGMSEGTREEVVEMSLRSRQMADSLDLALADLHYFQSRASEEWARLTRDLRDGIERGSSEILQEAIDLASEVETVVSEAGERLSRY